MLPPPAEVTPPVGRPPFVAGYLASAGGAAVAPAPTTVGDGRVKRRPAPTTDSVRGRLGLHIAAELQQVTPPAEIRDGSLVAAVSVPRTDAVGVMRTIAMGPTDRTALGATVDGLSGTTGGPHTPRVARGRGTRASRADVAPRTIGTGDVVVLQQHDAHIDAGARRPMVRIAGRARVVVLASHGVLADDDAVDVRVPVAAGATLIAVQADGDADPTDGYAGWQERSRVALVSARAAIAAGCTLVVDGRGSEHAIGWGTAAALTTNADEIATRFTRPIRTLAVALTGVAPRSLDRTQIHLVGGRVATDAHGRERPPMVVSLGATTVLVYQVIPARDATNLSVVIIPGADWVVTGVLGAASPNQPPTTQAELAEQLARQGLVAVTATLTAPQGPGCTAEWLPGDGPRPARKRTAKKTPAKKKATAKKTTAKKRRPR